MAGHSQFKNIMHRKGRQDAKRAGVFAKLAREITVAAKQGFPDPATNPRLRGAIAAARAQNMPKDNIERAINRASSGDDVAYEEVRYEGYGVGGVAVIVEALTDNRNRTASEVRAAFAKHGGNLGESGSVSFMFERIGLILYPTDTATETAVFEAALEAGADNIETEGDNYIISCTPDALNEVRDGLQPILGEASESRLDWRAQTTTEIDEETAETLMKMIDVLENNDDVQRVAANFEVDDALLARLSA